MELELKKECLDTYELGEPQTLTQEETAETIVPDYCPDIARIISAEGVVCLHGGTEQDGVTGTVRVTVLYTPENESGVPGTGIRHALFGARGRVGRVRHVVVETEIELLESRMLNPRKIFTRCKLVTHLAGCRKVCLTISSDAETDPALLVEKRCWWADGVFAAAGGGKGSDLFGDHVPVAGPGGCGGAAPLPGQRHRDGD